jgi:hypothetical protein
LSSFLIRYPSWANQAFQHQDIFTKIAQAKNRFLIENSGTIEQMLKVIDVESRTYWNYQIHCPFLVNRACAIYEVRPVVCASEISTDPASYCDPTGPHKPTIQGLAVSSDSFDISFWDKRLSVIYEDILPNIIFNTLVGGIKYLSKIPGLEKLYLDFCNDPELTK